MSTQRWLDYLLWIPPQERGGGGGPIQSCGHDGNGGNRPTDRKRSDLKRGINGRSNGPAVPLFQPGGSREPVQPHAPGVHGDEPHPKGAKARRNRVVLEEMLYRRGDWSIHEQGGMAERMPPW